MVGLSALLIWAFGKDGLEYAKTSTLPLIAAGLGYFAGGRRPT